MSSLGCNYCERLTEEKRRLDELRWVSYQCCVIQTVVTNLVFNDLVNPIKPIMLTASFQSNVKKKSQASLFSALILLLYGASTAAKQ
jgi:hypothetical protein